MVPNESQLTDAPFAAELAAAPMVGVRTWQAHARDHLRARLIVSPRDRIQVDLWWNNESAKSDVQLVFGIYRHSVELGALTGNGFDRPQMHRAGFGTFAVNIAIEALREVCG